MTGIWRKEKNTKQKYFDGTYNMRTVSIYQQRVVTLPSGVARQVQFYDSMDVKEPKPNLDLLLPRERCRVSRGNSLRDGQHVKTDSTNSHSSVAYSQNLFDEISANRWLKPPALYPSPNGNGIAIVLQREELTGGQRLIYLQPPWLKSFSFDVLQLDVHKVVGWNEAHNLT